MGLQQAASGSKTSYRMAGIVCGATPGETRVRWQNVGLGYRDREIVIRWTEKICNKIKYLNTN